MRSLYADFPEARNHVRREVGLRSIPLDEIAGIAVAGGAQRGSDFKPMPAFRGQNWEARWHRLSRATNALTILPPIDVMRFADRYWVEDGHNRVAAALRNGQVEIDAAVTDLRSPAATTTHSSSAPLAPMLEEGRELRAAGEGRFSAEAASLLASTADDAEHGHGHAHHDATRTTTTTSTRPRRSRVRARRRRPAEGPTAHQADAATTRQRCRRCRRCRRFRRRDRRIGEGGRRGGPSQTTARPRGSGYRTRPRHRPTRPTASEGRIAPRRPVRMRCRRPRRDDPTTLHRRGRTPRRSLHVTAVPSAILAASDEPDPALEHHQNRDRIGELDFLISCGDLEADWLSFLGDAFHAPIIRVLGNHDVRPDLAADRRPRPADRRHRAQPPAPGRGAVVAGQAAEARPCARVGPGAPCGPAPAGRGPAIVASHVAPAGLGDSRDPYHRGFAAYRWLLGRLRPPLWLHGHTNMASIVDWRIDTGRSIVANVTGSILVEVHPPAA